MSSNDDDDTGGQREGERPIAPDRQWVLRPNQSVAPPPEPTLPPEEPAERSTPEPPVPPPGAPGASGPVPPSGRSAPDPTGRPNIAAPQAQPGTGTRPAAIPITSSAPPAPAPPASGPVQSWGAPKEPVADPDPPARSAPAAAAAPVAPVQPPAGSADPPTLTPADSATAAPPVSRSTSPSNVTLGPPQRNVTNPAGAPQQPQQAPGQAAAPGAAAGQGQGQGQGRPAGGPARPLGKGGPTFADLAQQLAATQAQVAALSAQLTTLAHRLTYDVERGAQTTSERVTRDLERTLAEAVALRVGAHLGPAVDDLTDQIAEDFTPKLEAMAQTVGHLTELGLDARVAALTDAIDSMPIGNVEVIGQIDTLSTDLQDRLQRLSTRLFDQFENMERSQLAEMLRLRETMEELRTAGPAAGGGTDVETLRRIANHVERLAQRTPGTAGIVAAVETLITEHLDAVRTGLDEQVAALAPTMQVELDAVRAENLQALGSIEHELLEQVSTIETSLVERLDNLLADHLDSVDAVIADRQEGIVDAVATAGGDRIDEAVTALTDVGTARLEEVAAVANLGADRVAELATAVEELQATLAEEGFGGSGGGDPEVITAVEAMTSTVVEELQALRKKLNDTAATRELSPKDVDTIAAAVVRQIRAERNEALAPPAHVAKPRRGRGG